MGVLQSLGFAMGIAFASGLNLYATVATLGLLSRYGIVELPGDLAVLSHPIVFGVAIFMYIVEFFADKIPYVDTMWDFIHSFVRPPAAALLAYAAVGAVSEPWRIAAALLAGAVALTSHGTKVSTRAAVNTSPEPVSNWILSLGEDGVAIGLTLLAAAFPIPALIAVLLLLVAAFFMIFIAFKILRGMSRWVRGKSAGEMTQDPPAR